MATRFPDLATFRWNTYGLDATFTFASGMYVSATYDKTNWQNNSGCSTFGIEVGFEFGGGVAFDRRGVIGYLPDFLRQGMPSLGGMSWMFGPVWGSHKNQAHDIMSIGKTP